MSSLGDRERRAGRYPPPVPRELERRGTIRADFWGGRIRSGDLTGLLGLVLERGHHFRRLFLFVLDFVAVADLADPFENDRVADRDAVLDDEDVVELVLDLDLVLVGNLVLVDDVDVPLVEDLERRP